MTGEQAQGPIERRRALIVDRLCQHVADDSLSLDEFERRVDRAHRADSIAALELLVSDLPAIDSTGAAHPAEWRQQPAPSAPIHQRESQLMLAIMGGASRKGQWTPARRTTIIAMMGGVDLDFRSAALAPGVTEITVVAVMGGVEIIVPPGLAVECEGIGIMGGFDHHTESTTLAHADTPLLRIKGVALMGGVELRTRLPGESAADARRRQREELRLARKEQQRLKRENRSKGW